MSNFIELRDLPHYPGLMDHLTDEMLQCLEHLGRISLNTPLGYEDDHTVGTGSLIHEFVPGDFPSRASRFHEKEFTETSNIFIGTIWEEILEVLNKKYITGRVRIFKSMPMTCLSWHKDGIPRIHYPIKTQEGCMMVIDNEVKHLEKEKWWWTKTEKSHTAFNASLEERVHLVAVIRGIR